MKVVAEAGGEYQVVEGEETVGVRECRVGSRRVRGWPTRGELRKRWAAKNDRGRCEVKNRYYE